MKNTLILTIFIYKKALFPRAFIFYHFNEKYAMAYCIATIIRRWRG